MKSPVYNSMIKGASFMASNCEPKLRASIVEGLRSNGFRVDGVAKCFRTKDLPPNLYLTMDEDTDILVDYKHKKTILSKYLFHLAFENDVEPWHITEKAYHAMMAGTVPVYIGPSEDFKVILPHPKAVIFVADFLYNTSALAEYLNYLSTNETAYEEHRLWRHNFSREVYNLNKPELVTRSWHCRVCDWATKTKPIASLHDTLNCPIIPHPHRSMVTTNNNEILSSLTTSSGDNDIKFFDFTTVRNLFKMMNMHFERRHDFCLSSVLIMLLIVVSLLIFSKQVVKCKKFRLNS